MSLRAHAGCPTTAPGDALERRWRDRTLVDLGDRSPEDVLSEWYGDEALEYEADLPGPWFRLGQDLPTLAELEDDASWASAIVLRRSEAAAALANHFRAASRITLVDSFALNAAQRGAMGRLLRTLSNAGRKVIMELYCGIVTNRDERLEDKLERKLADCLGTWREHLGTGELDCGIHAYHVQSQRGLGFPLHDRYVRLEYRNCQAVDYLALGHGVRVLDGDDAVDLLARVRPEHWDLVMAALRKPNHVTKRVTIPSQVI